MRAQIVWAGTLLALAEPARAQLIEEALDQSIPGYGTEAGVTVTSRQHPEYDAPPVEAGNFRVTPALNEAAGYDDNVTGTAKPHGSALVETNPSVNVVNESAAMRFAAVLSADNWTYPEQPAQSYTDWSAALGIARNFGRDTLDIGYTHLALNETPRQLDAPLLDGALAYHVDDARIFYRIDLGHLSVQPQFTVDAYAYANGRAAGQDYAQSFRNRITYSPSLTLDWEFATLRRVVVILRDTQARYTDAPPGGGSGSLSGALSGVRAPREDYNDASVLAGLSYDLNGPFAFRVLAGYESRRFSSRAYGSIEAPIVEAAVTWRPTGLTTVSAIAARSIQDAAAEGTTGFTETEIKLVLDHEYLRNLILSAHLAYARDDYASGGTATGESQDVVTLDLGAQWKLNRMVWLACDDSFATRHGGGAVALAAGGLVYGGNFAENTVRVSVRLAL